MAINSASSVVDGKPSIITPADLSKNTFPEFEMLYFEDKKSHCKLYIHTVSSTFLT